MDRRILVVRVCHILRRRTKTASSSTLGPSAVSYNSPTGVVFVILLQLGCHSCNSILLPCASSACFGTVAPWPRPASLLCIVFNWKPPTARPDTLTAGLSHMSHGHGQPPYRTLTSFAQEGIIDYTHQAIMKTLAYISSERDSLGILQHLCRSAIRLHLRLPRRLRPARGLRPACMALSFQIGTSCFISSKRDRNFVTWHSILRRTCPKWHARSKWV